jgi:hypothetical protein
MDAQTFIASAGLAVSAWTLRTVHETAKTLAVLVAAQSEDRARLIETERKISALELANAAQACK